MAAPVWVLSVDLQTKTATFTTGLADAAKSARGSFQDIKDSAREMSTGVAGASSETEYSMMGARHGVMMLGEEFGVHLPRGITAFIVSLGPVGAAMEAAFPYLAIILGATLLIEHLVKVGDAADKLAETAHKMSDDMTLGINKATEGYIDAEIEIRNLAGLEAWDLLAEKMQLKDVDKGIENVNRLGKSLDELLKVHGATSNWNPFNWLDNSGDLASKIKALKGEMQGKSETEEAGILQDKLASQSKLLADMKGQSDVSKVQLDNQKAYVDWLKQATGEIQHQADTAVLADQGKQGKDRDARIKKEEEDAQRSLEKRHMTLEQRMRLEQEYDKKRTEQLNKGMEEQVKEGELEAQATMAVTKSILEAEKERARVTEELGKEEAEHIRKMAGLTLQAEEEQTKESVKLHRRRSDEVLAEQIAGENTDYAAQMRAYQIQLASLDKYGKDYEVKIKQINDREAELTKAHENKITDIKAKAEEERNARILASSRKFDDEIAQSAMKVLQGHESAGKALIGIGQQVAAGMMENAIKSILANDMTKESDAASAARKAFLAGWHFPWPVNIVMAPMLGAMAFASAMAFEEGGIAPGVEKGDVVSARLTPGEGIIPERVMTGLTQAAMHGNVGGGGGEVHIHHSPTYHLHMIDATGVDKMLEQHSDSFERHMGNALRKRNM